MKVTQVLLVVYSQKRIQKILFGGLMKVTQVLLVGHTWTLKNAFFHENIPLFSYAGIVGRAHTDAVSGGDKAGAGGESGVCIGGQAEVGGGGESSGDSGGGRDPFQGVDGN